MAERPKPTEFVYHNIELYKSESLGSGSYGGVCKAKCDGLLCAAKIMHPTLFDLRDPGAATYLSKFQEECNLLSLAKHPNVVQYLGTCYDRETRLPVLLMELCEESLTAFLERSPGPLSYHVQVDICHDIALALVYLHSNGLIHRDLTGNNVLMIAGPQAKITDFGMSKLASVNPRMTALTLCPGNVLYMSPEALDEAKSYTAKLDVFSFGVLVIQILTRQFPSPTDRFRLVYSQEYGQQLRMLVPDTERRAAHLKLILDTHSLKPLALQCLKNKEVERPSALELSERLSELKQSSQYRESRRRAESNQSTQRQDRISELEKVVGDKDRKLQDSIEQLQSKERKLQEKDQELQAKDREHQTAMEAKQREHQAAIQEKERVIASRDQALERQRRELQASEHLVLEFQQSLQQKDKTITDLQQTISAHERKIQQLEQQDTASRDTPHQKTVRTPQTTAAAGGGRDISKMKWRKGMNAPMAMERGAAVVLWNTAYFRPGNSVKVYSYQNIQREEQWSQLPDNPNKDCGLVVIDGLLTSIGGYNDDDYTNILLSLSEEGERKEWSEILPPMPTSRSQAACVTTGETLVVAGGWQGGGKRLDTVEVMNTNTKQWTIVSPLPNRCSYSSAAIYGDKLYLAGVTDKNSKSVFICSLPDLLTPPTTLVSRFFSRRNVWREISDLPVKYSTLVSFGGDLLAIGGRDDSYKPISTVYRYNSYTDSWTVASQMMNKRYSCFAVSLPEDHLIIVGGYSSSSFSQQTNSVEIGEI